MEYFVPDITLQAYVNRNVPDNFPFLRRVFMSFLKNLIGESLVDSGDLSDIQKIMRYAVNFFNPFSAYSSITYWIYDPEFKNMDVSKLPGFISYSINDLSLKFIFLFLGVFFSLYEIFLYLENSVVSSQFLFSIKGFFYSVSSPGKYTNPRELVTTVSSLYSLYIKIYLEPWEFLVQTLDFDLISRAISVIKPVRYMLYFQPVLQFILNRTIIGDPLYLSSSTDWFTLAQSPLPENIFFDSPNLYFDKGFNFDVNDPFIILQTLTYIEVTLLDDSISVISGVVLTVDNISGGYIVKWIFSISQSIKEIVVKNVSGGITYFDIIINSLKLTSSYVDSINPKYLHGMQVEIVYVFLS